jgi:hypothetical protein
MEMITFEWKEAGVGKAIPRGNWGGSYFSHYQQLGGVYEPITQLADPTIKLDDFDRYFLSLLRELNYNFGLQVYCKRSDTEYSMVDKRGLFYGFGVLSVTTLKRRWITSFSLRHLLRRSVVVVSTGILASQTHLVV